jgi:hypothetical protein
MQVSMVRVDCCQRANMRCGRSQGSVSGMISSSQHLVHASLTDFSPTFLVTCC